MVRTRLRINPVWLSGNREHIIVGVGKESRTLFGHVTAKAAPVTGTRLRIAGPVPADSRQYVCMYVFIKLHITTQSGPVILVILCHSH